MRRRDLLKAGLAAFAAQALPRGALADKYPDRPVRLIVPFPPGGAFDTIARPWAERTRPLFGQIVIENMGGAGGGVGAAYASHQRPDGYTLLLGGATTHITVNPSVPANDLKELVAYVKANPHRVSYGTAGHGSLNHLTGELFKLRAGITDLPHVPYRGAGPALTDCLAGQIPMIVPAMTNIVLEHHRAGKLRILAVTQQNRSTAGPELPTAVEQGFTDLVAPNYIGLFAPAGTPKAIVDAVSAANLKLLADKSYQELLISGTFELEPRTGPAEYKQYVENEMARWRPIVTQMGIKID